MWRSRGSLYLSFGTALWFIFMFWNISHSEGDDYNFLRKYLKKKCLAKSKYTGVPCPGAKKCAVRFEKNACFHETCPGKNSKAPCPVLFFYDNSSISRYCNEKGQWNISFRHHNCTRLPSNEVEQVWGRIYIEATKENKRVALDNIYVIFSWISFSCMVPSLIIMFYFMDKKNTRFNLHKNLIFAFLFRVVTFFVYHYGNLAKTYCNVFWVLNRFFAVSEVTWMLNEALFLLKLLFRTFDAKSYFWFFFAFGWGFPAVLVFIVYVPVMLTNIKEEQKDLCWITSKDSYLMFILYGPVTLMLVINLFTLIYVIRVLLQKLRTSTTSELLLLKKGIKAALILMPLLGIIYLMILYIPSNAPMWFNYLVRILYPMQGTLACLFYVVFNGEVLLAMKSRWRKWQTKSEFMERARNVDTRETECHDYCVAERKQCDRHQNYDLKANSRQLSINLEKCENGYITLTEVPSASTTPVINDQDKPFASNTSMSAEFSSIYV